MGNVTVGIYLSVAAALAIATVVITKDPPNPDILAVDNLYEKRAFVKTIKIAGTEPVISNQPQQGTPPPANLPTKGLPQPVVPPPPPEQLPNEPVAPIPSTAIATPSSRDVLDGKWIQAGDAQVSVVLGNREDVDKSKFPTIPVTIVGRIAGVGEFTLPIREETLQQNSKIEIDVKDKDGKVTRHDVSYIRNMSQGGVVELNFASSAESPVQRVQAAAPEDLPPPPPAF